MIRVNRMESVGYCRVDGNRSPPLQAPQPALAVAVDLIQRHDPSPAPVAGSGVVGSPHSSALLSNYHSRPRHRRRMPSPVLQPEPRL